MQIIKSYRKKKYLKKKKVTFKKTSEHGIKACHNALKERKKLTKKDIADRKKRLQELLNFALQLCLADWRQLRKENVLEDN